MKAAAIIHDDIWQQVLQDDMLAYETDEGKTYLWRDAVWDTGVDDDSNPYRRFLYNDEPVEVSQNTKHGGYIEIGQLGKWHVVFMASKGANLQAINALSANKVIALALIQTDGDGNVTGWNAVIDETDRAKVNIWLGNNGYPTIPEGASARQAVRRIWRVINEELDERSFDIKD